MTVGQRIKNRRKDLGITVDDIAAQLGRNRATVYRYESNDIENLPTTVLEPLAKILKTTPAYLMGWTDDTAEFAERASNQDTENWNGTIIPPTGMVPVIGVIPAGIPILAQQNIEGYMPVMVKNSNEYFYFRVKGCSMINANISDGSLVLIHRQSIAENGEIVACRVNGDEVTLKRFKQVGDKVVLLPENPDFQPMIVSCADFENGYAEIIGVAKQVMTNL